MVRSRRWWLDLEWSESGSLSAKHWVCHQASSGSSRGFVFVEVRSWRWWLDLERSKSVVLSGSGIKNLR
ncbi:hypothetical protein ACOSQ4_022848 [Xanthoceras sorbifolium]